MKYVGFVSCALKYIQVKKKSKSSVTEQFIHSTCWLSVLICKYISALNKAILKGISIISSGPQLRWTERKEYYLALVCVAGNDSL